MGQLQRQIVNAEDAALLAGMLGPATPLFGVWAAEADFAGLIAREAEAGPELVVELGSGSSTLVIAALLKRNGRGRLVSIDHDEVYADRTRALLRSAGLEDWVQLVVAPLRSQDFSDRTVAWYDVEEVERAIDSSVELVVVDGPPQHDRWSRWPALQVLHPHLAADAVVLADDGRTRPTLSTVRAWERDFGDLELYWIDTLVGTWMLRRSGPRASRPLVDSLLTIGRTFNPRPSGYGRWPIRR